LCYRAIPFLGKEYIVALWWWEHERSHTSGTSFSLFREASSLAAILAASHLVQTKCTIGTVPVNFAPYASYAESRGMGHHQRGYAEIAGDVSIPTSCAVVVGGRNRRRRILEEWL
jgi:hypothetical protein